MIGVDVIVPCYRYGRFLEECVHSVLSQQGVDVRVLVIDDASPDDSARVGERLARSDPRVTFRRHAANVGHIGTFNEGLAWARSAYLMLLSADDHLLPGALARATALLDADRAIGWCFGEAPELHDDGTLHAAPTGMCVPGGSGARVLAGMEFIELCRRRGVINFVPTPTVVVRTDLQHAVGGYRPELPHTGDMEMWLRLSAHGKVGFVGSPQAVYRRHAANMSTGYAGAADLLARKAAIDSFCSTCPQALDGSPSLRKGLLEPLGMEALHHANAAFNDGRLDLSTQLLALASELNPAVRRSFFWFVVACKRRMGERLWRAVRPAVGRLRGTAAKS